MADIKGILAIGDLPETKARIFSVNREKAATISSINITNTSGSTRTINLYLAQGEVVKHISPKDKVMSANAMDVIDAPYVLLKGEEIWADADGDKVEFVITGIRHE